MGRRLSDVQGALKQKYVNVDLFGRGENGAPSGVVLHKEDGTAYYLFAGTGGLRVHTSEPTDDGDGDPIGTVSAGSVSLEDLDSGIAPSHIVVAAGQHTTAGGDASESATASGVLATDIAVAVIEDNGTNNVTLLQTAAASNAVNFTLSGDPSTDAIINWVVFRAAS